MDINLEFVNKSFVILNAEFIFLINETMNKKNKEINTDKYTFQ